MPQFGSVFGKVRATNWTFIWEGGGYKLGPYCLKREQKCGSVFGKFRATNWAHICENASNILASYP